MKRLLMLLLLAAPVMAAGQVDLDEFKRAQTAKINELYTVPEGHMFVEVTCTATDPESKQTYGGGGVFDVDLSSAAPVMLDSYLLKKLRDHDGFCLVGPMDVEKTKARVLADLDAYVEYLRQWIDKQNTLKEPAHVDPVGK